MPKRTTAVVIIALLLGGGGWLAWQNLYLPSQEEPSSPESVVIVEAARVKTATWRSRLQGTGELTAVQGIEVRTEISGKISDIRFEAGEDVEAGDLLVHLDASVERAQVASLKAQERYAEAEYQRAEYLAERDVSSRSTLDQAEAELQRLRAEIEAQEAVIDKKRLEAPFAGKLGIRQVSLGQFVLRGDPIVELHATAKLFVDFALPEQDFGRVSEGLPVEVSVASATDRVFEGTITAIAPAIDRATRNFSVQATLDNDGGELAPGMFAAVTVLREQDREVTVLPASAISYNPYGDAVYVLEESVGSPEPNGTRREDENRQSTYSAERVFVDVGATRGTSVEIRDGVEAGQLVVTAGQLKLTDGAMVSIDTVGNSERPESQKQELSAKSLGPDRLQN